MLPYVSTELRMRLVREYAWMRPCAQVLVDEQRVQRGGIKAGQNMLTTITRSSP